MEHLISFPALGLEFTLNRVACNVFGKDIYWYGIIICIGFVLAALYVNARVKEFGVTSDNLVDCLIICVPTGIVCARIYYVIFEWGYYSQHPSEIIAIWNGGIAIYGAVIGVLIALCAPFIPLIYNTEPAVRTLTTQLLLVAGAALPLQAFAHVTYFTIRSGGKTFITFLFDCLYTWVVPLPIAFCLCRFTDLPVVWVYFCVQFADIVKVIRPVYNFKAGD